MFSRRFTRAAAVSAGLFFGLIAIVPAAGQVTANWLTDTSGLWTDPAMWSINPNYPNNDLPNPGDSYNVVIDAVGNNYTATLDVPVTINELLVNSPNATLLHQAGTFTLLNGGTIAAGVYQMNGGTLLGGGTLLIQSDMEWYGGAMAGTGQTIVAPGGMINATNGVGRSLSRLLDNRGTFNLAGGSLVLAGGTLLNRNGAVFNLGTSLFASGSGLISNLGTMNVSVPPYGVGTISINVPMINSGTINVLSGQLGIGSSGFTHNGGSVLRGPGAIDLGGASQTLAGGVVTFAGANMQMNGGAMSGPGHLNLTGHLNWNGGTIGGGGGSITVASGAVLNIGASGSPMQTRVLGRQLDNSGVVNLQGGSLSFASATFNNLPNGVLNLRPAAFGSLSLWPMTTNGGLISNQGTVDFNYLGGIGTIAVTMINSGTIIASAGTLILPSSMTHSAGSTLTGPGRIEIGSTTFGTHTLSGTTHFSGTNILFGGGVLGGPGELVVSGVLNWSGGTISGTGSTTVAMTIAPGGVLNLPQSFSIRGLGRRLINDGVINFSDGSLTVGSLSFVHNRAGGVLNLVGTTAFGSYGGGMTLLLNDGLTNYYGTGTQTSVLTATTNNGTIFAHGGTLILGGSTTFSHGVNSVLDGPGVIEMGGSTSFGTQMINGLTRLNGQNITFSNGTITGSGELVVNGALNWSGGTITGTGSSSAVMTVSPGAVVNLTSPGQRYLGRTLNNRGVVNLNSGSSSFGTLVITTAGSLNNLGDGEINIHRGFGLSRQGGVNSMLSNDGVIRTFGSMGSVTLGDGTPTIVNAGTISADSGSLVFGAGTLLHYGGSVIQGAGTIHLGSGNHQLIGSATLAGSNMILTSAHFTGPGSVNLTGTLSWRGGSFLGIGSVQITSSGHLNVGTWNSTRTLSGQLDSFGLTDFTAGTVMLSGGTFNNRLDGVLNISSPQNFLQGAGTALLYNAGTMNLADASIAISVPFVNLGVVNVLGAAALTSSDSFTNGGTINGATTNEGLLTLIDGARVGAIDGIGSVVVHSGAAATADRVRQTSLSIEPNASLRISPNGGAEATSVVRQLSIAATGQLDLSDNDLVLDYDGASELPAVRQKIADHRLSSALADYARALGSADNAALGLSEFSGQPVDSTAVLVKYTFTGDTNLDGQVDITDLGTFATHWQTSGVWTDGDFSYDDVIDITDLGLLATNWQAGVGSPLAPSLQEALASLGLPGAAVPEPAGLLAGGAMLMLASVRRRF